MFQILENSNKILSRLNANVEELNKSLEFEAGHNPTIDPLFIPMDIEFFDFEDTTISYIGL